MRSGISAEPVSAAILGIVLLSSLALPALSADFFWRPRAGGPYGAGDGSSYENAWHKNREIDWNRIAPGDTLYICGLHDGGYEDNSLLVEASGTADQPIRITGSCPDDPGSILSAGGRWDSGWSGPDEYGIYSHHHPGSAGQAMDAAGPLQIQKTAPGPDWSCRSFSQIERDFYYKPCGEIGVVYPEGGPRPLEIRGSDYVHVDSLVLENSNKLVFITNSNWISITNSHLRFARHSAVLVSGSTSNGVIRGNEIHDAGYGVYFVTQFGGEPQSHDDWILENNYIHDIYGTTDSHCIGWQTGSRNVVRGNRLEDCEGSGITFYDWGSGDRVAYNIIENNVVSNIRDRGRGGVNQRGIEVNGNNCPRHPDDSVGNIVRNNRVSNVDHTGLYVKSARPTEPGLFSWSFIGNVIENVEHGVVWPDTHGYGISKHGSSNPDPCFSKNLIPELSAPGFLLDSNAFSDVSGSFLMPKPLNPGAQSNDKSGIVARANEYIGAGTFVWPASRRACGRDEWSDRWEFCTTRDLSRYQEISGTEQGSGHHEAAARTPAP